MRKANPQPWISIINYEYRDSVVSSILHSLVCIVSIENYFDRRLFKPKKEYSIPVLSLQTNTTNAQ